MKTRENRKVDDHDEDWKEEAALNFLIDIKISCHFDHSCTHGSESPFIHPSICTHSSSHPSINPIHSFIHKCYMHFTTSVKKSSLQLEQHVFRNRGFESTRLIRQDTHLQWFRPWSCASLEWPPSEFPAWAFRGSHYFRPIEKSRKTAPAAVDVEDRRHFKYTQRSGDLFVSFRN